MIDHSGPDDFSHLLAPGRIGALDLANRVVLPGMDMNHCDEGMITPSEIAHYAARAAGGCGLVITGAAAVAWPLGATSTKQPALSDDRFLPGLAALADAVHLNGGRLCVQLVHHGKVASVDTAAGRPQLVPSVPPTRMDLSALADNPIDELMQLASATAGKPGSFRVATADDIAWAIGRFADAAGRVQAAGADAVEVHGAHGYLISTFLSRAYNQRDDEYGGSLENRSRILVEVIRAVRDRVGSGFPILVRLNGCEYGIDDGITVDETAATARLAEAAGADAIHVSANASNPFGDFTLGPLPDQVGQYRDMAAAVKRVVTVPVIAVGRLLPEVAEDMLAKGECDFVAMGRQQLADPDLVNKISTGRRASVRPCINCYVCVEQNFFDASPICAVNPGLGHESSTPLAPADTDPPRHVLIVGAGPAGLETARVAADRGSQVTVVERSSIPGGSTWFAELSGSPNQSLVEWLTHETDSAAIDIRFSTEATVASVMALTPDVVVIATGAPLLRVQRDGADASALVRSLALPGCERCDIAVIGGDMLGLSLADFLQTKGHSVTVLEPGAHFGLGMAMPRRWTAVATARSHGVILIRSAHVSSIDTEGRVLRYTAGSDDTADEVGISVDHIFLSGADGKSSQTAAVPSLATELRAAGIEVHVVGDAVSVEYLQGAIHSANAIARSL